jgi:hypothetical protein
MGPSATLVHAGLRTGQHAGWRGGIGQALAIVATTPALWLLGALGFLLRGGIVVLALPMLALPSPVAVRLLIGDNLGSAGFTPSFFLLVGVLATGIVALVMASLLVAAVADLAAFERFLVARHDAGADHPPARALAPTDRRRLVTGMFTIQLLAVCALLAAALPLVADGITVTYAELVRPSQSGELYGRVLGQLGGQLLLVLIVLVPVEAAAALAARRLLRGGFGLARETTPPTALLVGLGRLVLRPLSTWATALLGWVIAIGVLAAVVWAIGLVWQAARAALLDTAVAGAVGVGGAVLAVIMLCAVWLGGVAVCGAVGALRAGLWTAEDVR